ncbi:3-octaprenyl-4-hydroxybenzoate carboxy-lyase [Candidatus Caldarchaeum subterraneum]|uniref:Anhydromevalonate phosphate decarboxylase n=1 Tax=Caldiarchaeum subterraneum TaxID=311458 RepID=E6N555_CALS0|nr:3-octaprenyl-4-hydroxybenzoate carboxy-lyase [Candidatus Caldarchaeum subterraneum]BAJ49264.1 3-octaprenyl-4-hydroxybenzoate carboxy-lyase [Candidatus Caldarchaeum subterraneum]BAJ50246.1 3-octaprenyl-4-hydroxybenzoate carboxy-lyase [Candidatus Caldarchaeum subterraneum]
MKDLRQYLEDLRQNFPEEFVKISEQVSLEYEITAVWKMFERKGNPVLFFEKVQGCDMPVVANVFGSRARVARMIGADMWNFYDKWLEKTSVIVEPEYVSTGPVKEVKHLSSEVDLGTLPALKFFVEDGGRYITSGIVVANHPETGEVNLSFARLMVKDRNKLGVSIHSRGNLWRYFNRATELGRPWLNVAVVIGCNPTLYLAAATRTTDEYKMAGALASEPVQLVKCETNDVHVPSDAEIVLEGRMLTNVYEDEGPFSEYTGYVSGRSTRNVMIIDCITHRRNPIFQTIIPTNSSEHLLLGGLPMQANVYKRLKESIPEVKGINFPVWGTHFVAILSVDKEGKEGVQIRAAMLLMGANPYVKYVILVDDDIDVFDEMQVLWAVATRSQPDRSMHLFPVTDGNMLDPSQERAGFTSRAVIDATSPPHWKNAGVKVPSLPRDVVEKVQKKFK